MSHVTRSQLNRKGLGLKPENSNGEANWEGQTVNHLGNANKGGKQNLSHFLWLSHTFLLVSSPEVHIWVNFPDQQKMQNLKSHYAIEGIGSTQEYVLSLGIAKQRCPP